MLNEEFRQKKTKMSNSKIILYGNLIVNLPVISIAVITLFINSYLGFNYRFGLFIALILCWAAWLKLMNLWVQWAKKHHIEKEDLFYLGKLGFLTSRKEELTITINSCLLLHR